MEAPRKCNQPWQNVLAHMTEQQALTGTLPEHAKCVGFIENCKLQLDTYRLGSKHALLGEPYPKPVCDHLLTSAGITPAYQQQRTAHSACKQQLLNPQSTLKAATQSSSVKNISHQSTNA
jgi:hypothetical protein